MGRRHLLVEGEKDEVHVVIHLCRSRNAAPTFASDAADALAADAVKIDTFDGLENLLSQIPVRLKTSDLERFGVLLDAEDNAQARWDALRGRFERAGIPVERIPAMPAADGTIFEHDDGFRAMRIGVWIMPDNASPGMLESFLASLVPDGDVLLRLADEFVQSIPLEDRRFPNARLPKARIHAYLAVQQNPGRPFGIAIRSNYLDGLRPAADQFVNWLSRLFN